MTAQPPPAPRAAVLALADVAHGALDYAELESLSLPPEAAVDFSTNTNPYGPPPGVRAALAAAAVERYPDREALALRRALAARLDTPLESLLAGNGSAEILWLIAAAFLDAGERILLIGPTFGEYARAAGLMSAAVDEVRATSDDGFAPPVHAFARALAARAYRLAVICNPNNPTGQFIPAEAIQALAEAHPRTLFVIDEAYLAFAGGAVQPVQPGGAANLLALRSMTKDFALTGLRLGYAIAHPQVIAALRRVQPPWSVNAPAQAAGTAALADLEHVRHSTARLAEARAELCTALAARGYKPLPTATQFFLLPVGDARRFRTALLPYGLLVRDCTSFGLPEYVRIAARTPQENARLITAIDAVRP